MAEEIRVEVEGGTRGARRRRGLRWALLVPGLFFVGLGVLVIVVPEVITAMVAGTFILIGIGLLLGAARVGRGRARGTFFFDGRFRAD